MDRSYLDPDLDTTRTSRYSDHSNSTMNSSRTIQYDPLIKKKTQLSKAQLRDLCEPVFGHSSSHQQAGTVVDCLKLKTWSSISPSYQILDPLQHEQIHLKTPFPVNYKINSKLVLWVQDINLNITNLDCQAIVHTTSENFKEDIPLTRKIYAKAGFEMFNYLRTNVGNCKTGDVVVTNGFGLNSRYW